MSTSLSSLVDNLSKNLHCDNCRDWESELEYISVKDNQLIFQCFECKKNYQNNFNKKIVKRFENKYQFCNGDINNFVLLLGKKVYPHEYIDSWKRFDETR